MRNRQFFHSLEVRCLGVLVVTSVVLLPSVLAQSGAASWHRRLAVPVVEGSKTAATTAQAAAAVAGLVDESSRYRFVTVDVPGFPTSAYGINDDGLVSGFYFDVNSNLHAFLWRENSLRLVDYPGAVDTAFGASTNSGMVIGNYGDLSVTVQHAVTYMADSGTWTGLPDVPGYTDNFGNGINKRGMATGAACLSVPCEGWTWNGSEYSFFNAPGADAAMGGTYPNGINDRNEVAGQFTDGNGVTHGFLKDEEDYTVIDVPSASATYAFDVNDREEIVGYYVDASGNLHGFIQRHGQFRAINVPSSLGTIVYGNNSRGDLAGAYADSAGVGHGFLALKQPSRTP